MYNINIDMWIRNTMYLVSSFDSDSDHFSPEEADWGADEVDFIVLISLSFVNSWSFENSCRPCLTNLWTSILRSWCLSQRRTFLVNLKNWKKMKNVKKKKIFFGSCGPVWREPKQLVWGSWYRQWLPGKWNQHRGDLFRNKNDLWHEQWTHNAGGIQTIPIGSLNKKTELNCCNEILW